MSTEKTPLASPSTNFGSAQTIPFYVQDARRFYSRRRRERQLQCIMFITIVATFVMALIISVSYSVNHPDVLPTEPVEPEGSGATATESPPDGRPANPLQAAQLRSSAGGDGGRGQNPALSPDELQLAVAAGRAAIAARRAADSAARPLPVPSPNARHQYSMSTSPRADRLALQGLAELAATRRLESARSFMGRASSFGSYLDGGWSVEDVCVSRLYIRCPPLAAKYRRFDGSCNHPRQLGMAFTPFKRLMPPDYADGIEAPRVGKFGNPLPSAREVSLKVHPPAPSSNPAFTVMLAVFGQFLDHDVTATAVSQGTNGSSLSCCPPNGGAHPECFPVRIGPGDPVFDLSETTCMEFVRSAPAPQCQIGPRQQLNQVTSFIDGSMIYGSDVDTAEELRDFSDGRLRMQLTPDKRLLLPASTNPLDGCNRQLELARGRYCFATGDARANENLHLTTMHLLWARQHNRLAERLHQLNPQWDDETLYQEARRIVGAQLQHITYNEFLPIVLGESEMEKRGLKPLERGFRQANGSDVDPSVANHFAAAAFRFAHTLLPGLMKVTDKQKGTSSYVQLHRMLFNPYSLYAEGGVESSITAATSNTIQKTSTHVTSQLTAHLFEDPMGNKTVPCGLDLVSLNIQRGRDHGLPGYTKWREHCGLRKPLKFDDLKDDMDSEALDAISKLYDNVDDVDLYTGALAEVPRGDGLLGPTFTCLIANQFERLQQGDRYWYEAVNQSGSFNEDQLKEIRKTSLARIICDTSDGITEVQAQVMRSVSSNNPIISCEDIPKVSLTAWKTEMPLLTLSETEVPVEDWLNFKTEVNKTINDIVSDIMSKKPPPGSLPADWLAFKKDVNQTFTDLRNKFAALHPKLTTNVNLVKNLTAVPDDFDWKSIDDNVNSAISDIMDSINANKPAPGSPSADWLNFRKKIHDSLVDIRKKFKVIHPKVKSAEPASKNLKQVADIPTIDWNEIKNSINSTITDIIKSINASKPVPGSAPADWFAFRKKINDSLSGIKDKFKILYPKDTSSPVENLNKVDNGVSFDWLEFKDKLNKTLSDIIAATKAKRPPAGNTPEDWSNFEKEMNATFAQFMNLFTEIHSKTAKNTVVRDEFSNVSSFNDTINVNRTIADIIADIQANRPGPGSSEEDWLIFRNKLNNTFSKVKRKYAYLYPRVTQSESAADSTFDPVAFKEDLNKSLSDFISLIKSKKPALNSSKSDWLAYKNEIKSSIGYLKNKISAFKTKQLLEPDYIYYASEDSLPDESQWAKDIENLANEVKLSLPSDEVTQTNLQDYLSKSLANLKNTVSNMYIKTSNLKLMTIMKQDWQDFKNRINSTIEDALDDINGSAPAKGDPAWLTYNVYIKNRIAQMKDDIKSIKTEWLEKVKAATEMMTVTNSQLPTESSAFSPEIQLTSTKYYFISIVSIVLFVLN